MTLARTLVLGLLCWAACTSVRADPPALINREVFFGELGTFDAQISPDGKYVSSLRYSDSQLNVWVRKVDDPYWKAVSITAAPHSLLNYRWSPDSKFLFLLQDDRGNEEHELYIVDLDLALTLGTPLPPRNVSHANGRHLRLVHLSRRNSDTVFVAIAERDPAWPDLYRVNTHTGERELIATNTDRIVDWILDDKDVVRAAVKASEEGGTEILRVVDGRYLPLLKCALADLCQHVQLLRDGNIYLYTNVGRDLLGFARIDAGTGKLNLLESDPENRVDVDRVLTSDDGSVTVMASTYEDGRPRTHWIDAKAHADFQWLQQQLQGQEIAIQSRSSDGQRWIVLTRSDTEPARTYVFDRASKRFDIAFGVSEEIPRAALAPMQSIDYPSLDGLSIQAYLTLPQGVEPNSLPLVVLPHGGPWVRDRWGFDPMAQFLANRGYAVLQPNFRGSMGFGKHFLEAGNGEWGRKMQDDITAGVKYLVNRHIADPKRVGIVGGSYGGYAALAGATFTPDLYAAVVAIEGPTDLVGWLENMPSYWAPQKLTFYARVGDPRTPGGRASLGDESPLRAVNNVRVPLLIVQGANDVRVPRAQSDSMVAALQKHGTRVAYLVALDEGHGFVDGLNHFAMITRVEQFLAAYLGGRLQQTAPAVVVQRLREITVDPSSVH